MKIGVFISKVRITDFLHLQTLFKWAQEITQTS